MTLLNVTHTFGRVESFGLQSFSSWLFSMASNRFGLPKVAEAR